MENESLLDELKVEKLNEERIHDLDNKIRLLVNEIEKLLEKNAEQHKHNELLRFENHEHAEKIGNLENELHQIKELNLDYVEHHEYLMKQNRELENQQSDLGAEKLQLMQKIEYLEKQDSDVGRYKSEIEALNSMVGDREASLRGLRDVEYRYERLQGEYNSVLGDYKQI